MIGAAMPLTGDLALYGDDARRVLQLYLKQHNSNPETKYKYRIVLEDGGCGIGSKTSSAIQKLQSVDKVKFFILGCSGEVLQASPIVKRAGGLMIGFAASHPDIKKLGKHSFRTYVDMEKGIARLLAQVERDLDQGVVIITEENSFTLGIKKILEEKLGEKVVLAEDFLPGETNFRSSFLKAKQLGAGAWYFNAAGPKGFIEMFRQKEELSITAKVYGYYHPGDSDVLNVLGTQLDGVVYLGEPQAESSSKAFQNFLADFKKEYSDPIRMLALTRSSYDAIDGLRRAIEAVGKDPKQVAEFLLSHEWEGATGLVNFDQNGDLENFDFSLQTIRNGQASPYLEGSS